MTLEEAKSTLKELKHLPVSIQLERVEELNDAFRVFINSRPTEDEFAEHMGHIVLTARILWVCIDAMMSRYDVV